MQPGVVAYAAQRTVKPHGFTPKAQLQNMYWGINTAWAGLPTEAGNGQSYRILSPKLNLKCLVIRVNLLSAM